MDGDKLRKAIRTSPSYVRSLMLTDRQVRLLKFIKDLGWVSVVDVADLLSYSDKGAAKILKQLFDMGYLNRKSFAHPKGTFYYLYKEREL